MKVVDYISKKKPFISFEIVPPYRGEDINNKLALIKTIAKYKPPFIDVTSHSSEIVEKQGKNGSYKRRVKKRPGTIGVCSIIQYKYGIDAIPHVLCKGFTKEESEDYLIDLRYMGFDNVLAIQGDPKGFERTPRYRTPNPYASDLVQQISNMNNGIYVDEDLSHPAPSNFCIGVAGYPEKHYLAPDMETDIKNMKQKIDAGADYIVTQMFFDTRHYENYVKACRKAGINVPIIPGLKIFTVKRHLEVLPRVFHTQIPEELATEVQKAKDEDIPTIGVKWAAKQTAELLNMGAPGIHYFVFSNEQLIDQLMEEIYSVTPL